MFGLKLGPRTRRFVLSLSLLGLALPGAASSWVKELSPAHASDGIAVVPRGNGSLVVWANAKDMLLHAAEIDGAGTVQRSKVFQVLVSKLVSGASFPDGGAALAIVIPFAIRPSETTPTLIPAGEILQMSSDLEQISVKSFMPLPESSPADLAASRRILAVVTGPAGISYLTAEVGADRSMILALEPNLVNRWATILDWPGDQAINAIAVDRDGVIVAGTSSGQAVVARFDASGKQSWQRVVGPGDIRAIAAGPDGTWLVAGVVSGSGKDILVGQLDQDGSARWLSSYGTSADEWALSVHQSKTGSILVGAAMSNQGTRLVAVELSADGGLTNNVVFNGSGPDGAFATSAPDGKGALVLALAGTDAVVVARYDGADSAPDCASPAALSRTTLQASAAGLPLETRDAPFFVYATGSRNATKTDLVTHAAECGSTAAKPTPVSAEAVVGQLYERILFEEHVFKTLGEKRFDELEELRSRLVSSHETFANGDWKIYHFYKSMAPYCKDDCRKLLPLLEEWKTQKPHSPTPRIALAGYFMAAFEAAGFDGDLATKANEELAGVELAGADQEYHRLVVRNTHFTDGDLWKAFERATAAAPDYYYIYTNTAGLMGRNRAGIERVVARGVALTRSTMGESILARVASRVQFSNGDQQWLALNWPRIQSAYHDLFKVYPASYKNMYRFAILACSVRDRQVMASIVSHLGREAYDTTRSQTEWSNSNTTECDTFAERRTRDLWVDGPVLAFGQKSSAKGLDFAIPSEGEKKTRWSLFLLSKWVYAAHADWPRLAANREDAAKVGLSVSDVGFFARASDSRVRYVTASRAGYQAIGPVMGRARDGSAVQLQPDKGRDPRITRSATFAWDAQNVTVLESILGPLESGDRIYIVVPDDRNQTVLTGSVRNVVDDPPMHRRPVTFDALLPPGTALPPPGSPVLSDRGSLVGVVVDAFERDSMMIIECEGASIVLSSASRR